MIIKKIESVFHLVDVAAVREVAAACSMEEIVLGVLDVCRENGFNPTGALAAFVCQTVRFDSSSSAAPASPRSVPRRFR